MTRHLASLLLILALSGLSFAAPVSFSGFDSGTGPPFPTSPLTVNVTSASGVPMGNLLVSIPTATPNTGLGFRFFGNDAIAKFDAIKLENYDFPGQYAQRFDGVDPGGQRHPVSVVQQSFSSGSFRALFQVDLPADPPENHLYYTLTGSIYPGQPVTFTNFSALGSPAGYFEINFSFSGTAQINPIMSILLMDMTGTTTPIPEPGALSVALLAAVSLARYHRRFHG